MCEGDIVLGVAEIHLLDLPAGRVSHIDDWFALGSGGALRASRPSAPPDGAPGPSPPPPVATKSS